MSRRDRIARNRHADLMAGAVDMMRATALYGLGFNCTFVDDDMKILVALAQRAVLAGLASDFTPDIQKLFSATAERFRKDHEHALGREIAIR